MDGRPVLAFTNPATGEQFGEVPETTSIEVRAAHTDMAAAFKVWSAKPLSERIRILRKFQEVMLDSLDEITAVMNQDCGKSRQDALIEIFITADVLHQYMKNAPRWLRRERVSTGFYLFKRAFVDLKPYGVVGIIAPWNYPFALSVPPVIGALLAGNTVLLKPSEVTGATGVMIDRLFQRVPELAPYIRVLHGGGGVGAALVQSSPDYIFLTGSSSTGQKVLQAAAESLTPVACELGGKDPMLVLEDADLEAAAHWGVWGACFNTGQTCMAVERVYVVESVYNEFVRLAVEETHRLKVGYTPDLRSPYYLGPVTDPRQVQIIQRHLQDAVDKGARILTGGQQQGMFFEPTVLVDVDHSMLLMQEETFGPLLPVMKVKDEAEAIRLANDCKFGLGASIWSRSLPRAQQVAQQLEAGTILVNDTIAQFAIPMLPFGGIKQSGYGRTHGKYGLLQFTQPYAYAYGNPPSPYDFATLARKPGNYHTVAGFMRLVFGVRPGQRLQPLGELLEKARPNEKTAIPLGASLAAAGLLAGALITRRRRSH